MVAEINRDKLLFWQDSPEQQTTNLTSMASMVAVISKNPKIYVVLP